MTIRSSNKRSAFSSADAPRRDPALDGVAAKLAAGRRLEAADGLALFRTPDLLELGRLAGAARRRRHGRATTYVVNQHLNYTNICVSGCRFCAFARRREDPGAYVLSLEEALARVRDAGMPGVREIHIVGGVHPDLPLDYYLDLVAGVKALRPQAAVKAFTAVEIHHLARINGLTLDDLLGRLRAAGLDMLPGGGAEVLSERIHGLLHPNKIGPREWLAVHRAAHAAGLPTNATLLYGHLETAEERVDHLLALRRLQDETGGLLAFIPLAFHPAHTGLAHLPPATAVDDLRVVAAARLLLDNVPHIKAYWVMIGPDLAQVAMDFGADDLDGTIVEEKITHTAGAQTPRGLDRETLRDLIRRAGYLPEERDAFYCRLAAAEAIP